MAKYNVGDVLEITEDFDLEGAVFKVGQKYTVEDIFGASGTDFYELEDAANGYLYHNTISEVDAHSGFRKVEPKVEFKRGDKVRLLEGAHGNPAEGYSWATAESFRENYGDFIDLTQPFEVVAGAQQDDAGETLIKQNSIRTFVLPEFLVPFVEESDTQEEPSPEIHMELGKTYKCLTMGYYYRPTKFDFESCEVFFDFGDDPEKLELTTERLFDEIEGKFGVLPPVKPVSEADKVDRALDELKEKLKPKNSLAEAVKDGKAWWVNTPLPVEVETVSVEALREALDFLGIQEVFDIENIISLAKRLS